ncbi:MAG: hypothetical protein NC925_02605 [Candidatus Omnitrophica bacterium]|nr:hypothetical protein [Candidatus Omnitrophota bacterium]
MKVELELIYEHNQKRRRKINREKNAYKYISKILFKEAYKLYSLVLKGFPDFMVISSNNNVVPAGFYEIKLQKCNSKRKRSKNKDKLNLSKAQEYLLSRMAQVFPTFLILICEDGTFKVYKIKNIKTDLSKNVIYTNNFRRDKHASRVLSKTS